MRFQVSALLYLLLMATVPALVPSALVLETAGWARVGSAVVAPVLYAGLFGLVAGGLGRLHASAVVPGRKPRDLSTAWYRERRLHGLCWTAVYYFKPVYWLWLTVPGGRGALFRLFGYRGASAFTTYPDTWIRDLPLLELGEGAYLSNRATIGTNIVLKDGSILVDRVVVGRGAVVGHLAVIGPGCELGANAELGVGCGLGIGCRLGDGVELGPKADLDHGVVIGPGTRVGSRSYVGTGAVLGPGLRVPPHTFIPAKTKLEDQAAVDRLLGRGEAATAPTAAKAA